MLSLSLLVIRLGSVLHAREVVGRGKDWQSVDPAEEHGSVRTFEGKRMHARLGEGRDDQLGGEQVRRTETASRG